MRGFTKSIGFFIIAALASGCSSETSPTMMQPANGIAPTTLQRSVDSRSAAIRFGVQLAPAIPAPFSGTVSNLRPDSTAALNLNPSAGPPRFLSSVTGATRQRGQRPASSVPVYDQGGQAGVSLPGGNGYIGIYSINTAYQSSQIQLNPWDPADPTNVFDVLYAPTTHGTDGACLENGSDYWRYENSGSTSAVFRIYSGCGSGGFVVAKNIDTTFAGKYVAVIAGGTTPTYVTEVVKMDDGKWHSLLYNFNTQQYEDLYSVAGSWSFNGGQGWDMFETHYTIGPCSQPPEIDASGIRVQSPNGSWSLITSTNSSQFHWGDCLDTYVNPYTNLTFPAPPQIGDPKGTEWWAKSH